MVLETLCLPMVPQLRPCAGFLATFGFPCGDEVAADRVARTARCPADFRAMFHGRTVQSRPGTSSDAHISRPHSDSLSRLCITPYPFSVLTHTNAVAASSCALLTEREQSTSTARLLILRTFARGEYLFLVCLCLVIAHADKSLMQHRTTVSELVSAAYRDIYYKG